MNAYCALEQELIDTGVIRTSEPLLSLRGRCIPSEVCEPYKAQCAAARPLAYCRPLLKRLGSISELTSSSLGVRPGGRLLSALTV